MTGYSPDEGEHPLNRMKRSASSGDHQETRYDRDDGSPPPLLDPMQIPWYHPHITRNLAEAELHRAEEGVYLMRPRRGGHSSKGFAIDVRTTHTVKHFPVVVKQGGTWTFGQETFSSLPSFLEHFDNRPLLGDEGGKLIVLKYPYPREVEENPDYHSAVTAHFLSNPPKPPNKRLPSLTSDPERLSNSSGEHSLCSSAEETTSKDVPSIHSVSLASKAGYLVKMGGRIKSWKKRWFVLKDRHLSYYTKDTDSHPLRMIDLSQATCIGYSDDYDQKPNIFKIVLPWRTFYLQALTEQLRKEWVQLLCWRMREIQKLPESSRRSST